jgi:para-aminobenzoate synthetase component 1
MKRLLVLFETKEIVEISGVPHCEITEKKVPAFFCRTGREKYIETVNKLLKHIQRGDIYEINYCIEFFAENCVVNPCRIFERLKNLTEAPYAQLVRSGNTWIICASPERFIKREGAKLITQPMKGTSRRSTDSQEDKILREKLASSKKEQTENVMAVDVARNDLSLISTRGSVKTDELFGVHTFRNVHQMVSTVSCELRKPVSFEKILDAVFPPASMTGAPKLKALELIARYEDSPRGIYSGCMGELDESGNFDFCVVIRTILYDEEKKKLSFHVGSAITAASNPEEEWNECLLKAKSLLEAIGLDFSEVKFQ